jgi:hypothetical protein
VCEGHFERVNTLLLGLPRPREWPVTELHMTGWLAAGYGPAALRDLVWLGGGSGRHSSLPPEIKDASRWLRLVSSHLASFPGWVCGWVGLPSGALQVAHAAAGAVLPTYLELGGVGGVHTWLPCTLLLWAEQAWKEPLVLHNSLVFTPYMVMVTEHPISCIGVLLYTLPVS